MKFLLITTFLISFAAHADQPTLKIDVRCGILMRPSIVDVVSIYINGDPSRDIKGDALTNYDGGYAPYSQIHRGKPEGISLKVIGNKLFLANLDGSRINIGTVEQETECNWENLETFSVNQASTLDVSIETGPSQCLSRRIDSRVEHFWMATRTFKFTDRVTSQQAIFSTPIRPDDDPNSCQ